MSEYEEKLKVFMRRNVITADHLFFKQSCHTVDEAARAAGVKREDFVKNICMVDFHRSLIVAIVKGEDKVNMSTVAKILDVEKVRIASPVEILEMTGYPCGGVPSFGYPASFLIDQRVMEKEFVYSGGGSEHSLVKISPKDLQKANNGRVVSIHK